MKSFLQPKILLQAFIINILCILTIIASKYLIEATETPQETMDANIGGGLMILSSPIITCFLIGLWRKRKNKTNAKEIWIMCYFIMIIIELITTMIVSIYMQGADLFLISTLSIPFDSMFLIMYYLSGYFGEKQTIIQNNSTNMLNIK